MPFALGENYSADRLHFPPWRAILLSAIGHAGSLMRLIPLLRILQHCSRTARRDLPRFRSRLGIRVAIPVYLVLATERLQPGKSLRVLK